jgi:hypothetical protein
MPGLNDVYTAVSANTSKYVDQASTHRPGVSAGDIQDTSDAHDDLDDRHCVTEPGRRVAFCAIFVNENVLGPQASPLWR